jgi:2-polyprenyl-6-methoxyphenol hydroxylase-like FAD-dependent oxidoreductase
VATQRIKNRAHKETVMGIDAQAQTPAEEQPQKKHALVIGGSIAGLLAARVLSDYFEHITIIDRDTFPTEPIHRKGASQSYHTHGLSGRGRIIIEQLFPGIFDDLRQAGAHTIYNKVAMVMVFAFGKIALPRPAESMRYSRPLLEWHLRQRLIQEKKITILNNQEVTELLATPDQTRIVGVKMRERGLAGQSQTMHADLIIDASGRNSKTPQWLTELGYEAPVVESVNNSLGYASRFYEKPADFPDEWQGVFILPRPTHNPRSGTIAMIEHNVWHVTLSGVGGHYPPTDEAGFLQWARDLPDPTVYETIRIAKPLTPIRGYRVLEHHIRHYEQLQRWPAGLLVIGDAVCALNPIRGQGMAASALQAHALNECLREQEQAPRTDFERFFMQQAIRSISDPWLFSLGEDLRWPGVAMSGAESPVGFKLWLRYLDLVLQCAVNDQQVGQAYMQVFGMLAPQSSLAKPQILFRVIKTKLLRMLGMAKAPAQNQFALSDKALAQLRSRAATPAADPTSKTVV